MISAVESHYGTGPTRPYSHHFDTSPSATITTNPSSSSSSSPLSAAQMPPTSTNMLAAEFARPHPKPRYSNGPLRNGLSSSVSSASLRPNNNKYSSEQTGPVNLAVSQSDESRLTSKSTTSLNGGSQQRIPYTDSSMAAAAASSDSNESPTLYGASAASAKLSFCPTSVNNGVGYPLHHLPPPPPHHHHQPLNYSSLYGHSSIYGSPMYASPHLTNRSNLHRPGFQLEPYASYLPTYSPPGGGAPPPPPLQTLPHHAPQPLQHSPQSATIVSSENSADSSNSNNEHNSLPQTSPSSISNSAKLINERSHHQQPQAPPLHQLQQHNHHSQQQHSSHTHSNFVSNKHKEKLEGKVQSGHQHHQQQQQQQQQQHQQQHHHHQQQQQQHQNHHLHHAQQQQLLAGNHHHLQSQQQQHQQQFSSHYNNNNNNNSSNNNQHSQQNAITSNGKTVGFKVPSGKEGSLKHRILTRPYPNEKDGNISTSKHRSSTSATAAIVAPSSSLSSATNRSVVRSSSSNNSAPTNFTKGSLIELYNGELRRVEDMRTEDFILSSNKNPELKLAETTVVKISQLPSNVLITFTYDNLRFDMESTVEHPFFVYGQGWASFDPDGSARVFGLKCQRLQVGDVCISLTPRDSSVRSSSSSISHLPSPSPYQHGSSITLPPPPPPVPISQNQPAAAAYYTNSVYNYCKEADQAPQNLSRKQSPPQLPPPSSSRSPPTTTSAASTTPCAAASRAPPGYFIDQLHQSVSSASYAAYLNNRSAGSGGGGGSTSLVTTSDDRRPHSNQSSLSLLANKHNNELENKSSGKYNNTTTTSANENHHRSSSSSFASSELTTSSSSSVVDDNNHRLGASPSATNDDDHDVGGEMAVAPIDATISRKRRWSAPDNICELEDCQKSGKKCNH